jgi:predicted nucleic acid binding AN1-type Zn finger protein
MQCECCKKRSIIEFTCECKKKFCIRCRLPETHICICIKNTKEKLQKQLKDELSIDLNKKMIDTL